jgi:hypothetical protein
MARITQEQVRKYRCRRCKAEVGLPCVRKLDGESKTTFRDRHHKERIRDAEAGEGKRK